MDEIKHESRHYKFLHFRYFVKGRIGLHVYSIPSSCWAHKAGMLIARITAVCIITHLWSPSLLLKPFSSFFTPISKIKATRAMNKQFIIRNQIFQHPWALFFLPKSAAWGGRKAGLLRTCPSPICILIHL